MSPYAQASLLHVYVGWGCPQSEHQTNQELQYFQQNVSMLPKPEAKAYGLSSS